MPEVDVAIVGGGPVGAALAALAGSRSVAVFEARAEPSTDARTLALSHASRELLEGAGAWPVEGVTPITSIHVSQRGGPGRTVLEAAEQGLPALGYTVAFSRLEHALDAALDRAGVAVHRGARCRGIALDGDGASVSFEDGREVRARLLVLADGGANASRIPGIAFEEKDYAQVAVVAPLEGDRPHRGRAYERFTPRGPIALLPVGERYGLVWTASPHEAPDLLALEDATFLARLQEAFGDRAGRLLSVGARASFPLRLRRVNTPIALRTAIIGNAAQSMHPVAGQGLNLGLRDAAVLAEAIAATPRKQLGGAAMLAAYRDARRRDAGRGVVFTDALVSLFSDARGLPTIARGLAQAAQDLVPPARRLLARRMIYGAAS
jgi:2-octaprenyl-6-methoxyphenol hydroxylase